MVYIFAARATAMFNVACAQQLDVWPGEAVASPHALLCNVLEHETNRRVKGYAHDILSKRIRAHRDPDRNIEHDAED